jgi:hypothetical protein
MRWNLAAPAALGVASILNGCTTAPAPVTTQATSLPPDPPPPFSWPTAAAKTGAPLPVTVAVLDFAWPRDVQAQESIAETATVLVTGKPAKTATKSYAIMMTAAPVAEGARISYSDMQVEMPDLTEHARALLNASIEPMTAIRFPPFLITPKGKFLRVDNVDQVVADAKSLAEAGEAAEGEQSQFHHSSLDGHPAGHHSRKCFVRHRPRLEHAGGLLGRQHAHEQSAIPLPPPGDAIRRQSGRHRYL